MHKNRGNRAKDATQWSNSTDPDLSMDDPELEPLVAGLEASVPKDIVTQTFRTSLLSKLINLQEHASKDSQGRVSKK